MFFQQAMKPQELLSVLPHVSECFFVVNVQLLDRTYQLAVYKYQESYFRIQDMRVFHQVYAIVNQTQGDEEELLPFIEQALEDNLYRTLAEWLIQVDLSVLAVLPTIQSLELVYYEFIEN
ncbi:hypothetical protein [Enterococcus bulliens]